MAVGVLVSTGLQLLAAHLPTGHPASAVGANLSGITAGGLFMVIGFLKDDRIQHERQPADRAAAELNRLRDEYEAATKALIRRLEEPNGNSPDPPGSDR